ncbi:MAG: methionine--tRNA ligase [Bacteriovoracaceae bacterium]|nr:methionine--tRNA ligase [Bacteriovoracaceae bacterium]
MKKYLITSALPYANGPLHFGHLTGVYIPADIFTRHKRLKGEKVMHICGSDEHGVAIMLNAKKVGEDYKSYVDKWHAEHKELFKTYNIDFDFFGQTSASYHEEEVLLWFKALHEKGLIAPKEEKQLFCEDCRNYLPDRFVEGTCYTCGYESARGDECPSCGEWIDSIRLKNPVCKICSSKNITTQNVTQWYLMMSKYHKEFRDWFETKKASWRKTVVPYVDSLSEKNLQDRAITRDLDWGIDVPLPEAKGKKLYVWFDAPIGYVSNTKEHLKNTDEDYLKDWWQNKETEIINFIGKDNIIFHTVIFPVMSMAAGRVNPVSNVPANQFLNLAGKQFSKSSGWYIDAKTAIDEFGSDALRYYLASIIPETTDSSFTWEQFSAKVNGELLSNVGNFVNRGLKFSHKTFPEGIAAEKFQSFFALDLCQKFEVKIKELHELLDNIHIKKGLEHLMQMSSEANTYFSDLAPWSMVKLGKLEEAQEVLAHASVLSLILGVLFEPYLPALSANILKNFPNVTAEIKQQVYQGNIQVLKNYFKDTFVLPFEPQGLVAKIDEKRIKELVEELNNLGKK